MKSAAIPTRKRAPKSSSASPARSLSPSYFQQSQRPFPSHLFLLPLIICYELGTRMYAVDPLHHTEVRIIAFNLLRDFFHFFGATGKYLPAFAVVGILLTWHIARNDPWIVPGGALVVMAFESLVLALPVILLSFLSSHHLPLLTGGSDWKGLVVLSLGAGIYEEMVFRLICFTVLNMVLLDALKLPKLLGALLIVLIPAALFSLYHYLGTEAFSWQSFVFRTLAGIYFGILFLFRGFGITAGSHAAYDILIVAVTAVA
jgi:hypothetical protein